MKRLFTALLCAALLLTGCQRDTDGEQKIIPDADQEGSVNAESGESPEIPDEPAETVQPGLPGAESENAGTAAEEQTEPITAVPDVIFALRKTDRKDLPEDVVIGDELAEAIARTVLEQIGEPELLIRVLYAGIPEYYGGSDLHVEYEVYPKDCGRLSPQTRLTDGMQLEIARKNGGYAPGVPRVYDEERIEALRTICREGNFTRPEPDAGLFLDRENKICLVRSGEILVTEQYFYENINELESCTEWCAEGDTVVLLAHESRYYSDPFSIHVSRNGGKTWTKTVPELAPLGKNGQHPELGFLEARIQIRENGQIFLFTGTNLASLNVFTVPADSEEVLLLFREQIGGYETNALVDAAMISDKRGYITLMHPKYAASNAIYRTTDGGLTWVRCSVPMPEACTNVWEMRLFLPQVQSEWLEWTMIGNWETGSCVYASHDGGWTWEISE